MVLELLHDTEELVVRLREMVGHRVERFGDANAGDYVFALRVHQEVAVGLALNRSTGCA
jgi:predicted metalloprotease with PDZ domain